MLIALTNADTFSSVNGLGASVLRANNLVFNQLGEHAVADRGGELVHYVASQVASLRGKVRLWGRRPRPVRCGERVS